MILVGKIHKEDSAVDAVHFQSFITLTVAKVLGVVV